MQPKVSIVIPFHWMKNWQFFLTRCLESIESQTFKDYEVILMKVGSMPVTSNRVMESAKGELIKILYMDDQFSSEWALDDIVMHFKDEDHWMITGCDTNPHPRWTEDIYLGNNKLGSPSCLTVRRESVIYFDEKLSWLLDADLYKRMFDKYGLPKILNTKNILIGVGDHQMTNLMSDDYKLSEHEYVQKKYGLSNQ